MPSYQKKKFDKIHQRNYYAKDLYEGKVFKPQTVPDKSRAEKYRLLEKDIELYEED